MKNLFLFIFFVFSVFVSFSQKGNADFEEKMQMKKDVESFSWFYKNVFLDHKIGLLSEFYLTPTRKFVYLQGDYLGDPTLDTVVFTDANYMLSVFHYAIEPRINILNTKRTNVFLKAPISVSFSVNHRQKQTNLNRNAGYFSCNLPVLIGFGKGLNSSFKNASKKGFAISAGYQLLFSPLIGGNKNFLQYVTPINETYKIQRIHGMPIVQFDYYYLSKRNKVRGYSLTFCPYKAFYVKLAWTFEGFKK